MLACSWIGSLSTSDKITAALGLLTFLATAIGILAAFIGIRLSKKVVAVEEFAHKKNVEPNLTLQWTPINNGAAIRLTLNNGAAGKASIRHINASIDQDKFSLQIPPSIPFDLLRNEKAYFRVESGMPMAQQANDALANDYVRPTLIGQWVSIYYTDLIGTPYNVYFTVNAVGNMFESVIQELNPKAKGFSRFFRHPSRSRVKTFFESISKRK